MLHALYRMGKTEAHAGLPAPVVAPRQKKAKSAKSAKSGQGVRSGNLVIVESPAKAKTVGRFLGKGYTVRASVGHVRDLLKSTLSVDVDHDFAPKYRVPNEKKEVVKTLKAEAAQAEAVYLATDPDREGEAIAWHLLEAAEIEPARARRVAFHEITKTAIGRGFRAVARHSHGPGQCPADPAHPRPPGGLLAEPITLGQGARPALGGAGAIRGRPAYRGPRA